MDQRKRLDAIRELFSKLRDSAAPESVGEQLERIATGAFLWWLLLKFAGYRLRWSSDENKKTPFIAARHANFWKRCELAYRFGRRIKPDLLSAINYYQRAGFSDRDLRLLVVNRILRNNGELHISMQKEWILLILGWFFMGLCAIGLLLILGLIWLSPATVAFKLFTTCLPLAVFVPCGYIFSCYSIKPFSLVRIISRESRPISS